MINLDKPKEQREEASQDKADLFDFYECNWDKLIDAISKLLAEAKRLRKT